MAGIPWTGANLVTVPLGDDGAIDIYNYAGSTHVVVDLLGVYAADDSYRTSSRRPRARASPTSTTT